MLAINYRSIILYLFVTCMICPLYKPLYISMIPKYLYDLNYFISIYKYIVFYMYIL